MYATTTAICLDTRTRKKDGTYPIKLRVTYRGKQKYLPLNHSLTEEDFNKTQSKNPRGNFKDLQIEFSAQEKKAIDIINKIPVYSFELFKSKFYQFHDDNDAFQAIEKHINDLIDDDRTGNADTFKNALSSFKKFTGNDNLMFSNITSKWLNDYEKWMLNNGKSPNTIGIYLRSLRSLFNLYINNGYIDAWLYPFKKGKFLIPKETKTKQAITKADLKLILNYTPANEAEEKARDMWIFSCLCNGMNFKDMVKLRYKDIDFQSRKLEFTRTKTARTKRHNSKKVIVSLLDESLAIINKWGSKPITSDNLIFDFIDHTDDATSFQKKTKQATKTINKYMKRIGLNLGIITPVKFGIARHTFATILMQSNAPTELIKESLGHSNVTTTQHYLGSFDDDVKRDFQKMLLD